MKLRLAVTALCATSSHSLSRYAALKVKKKKKNTCLYCFIEPRREACIFIFFQLAIEVPRTAAAPPPRRLTRQPEAVLEAQQKGNWERARGLCVGVQTCLITLFFIAILLPFPLHATLGLLRRDVLLCALLEGEEVSPTVAPLSCIT
jgi:hypothetical protein